MKNKKYTRSRMHEKFDKFKKVSCGIAGLFLASTIVLSVFAKDNKHEADVYSINTVNVTIDKTIGNQRIISINTLEKEGVSRATHDSNFRYIRCTVYCDTGYTASGTWTTAGCLAGKKEWIGKKCRLYRAYKDGSRGECIGTFTFEDTGFGLEELDGINYPNGTLPSGASIDMWHPTEEECWAWVAKYGDYVYIEFLQ